MDTMKNGFEKIKSFFFSRRFVKFIEIGIINGFNGVFFSYVFSLFLSVNISFVFGYAMSLAISYFLNSFFVFKRRFTVERFVKFYLSYIPNFIIQNTCVFIFFNCLGWHEIIAFVLAGVLGVPVTYIILNLLTFRTKK